MIWKKARFSSLMRWFAGIFTLSKNTEPRPTILVPTSLKRARLTPGAVSGADGAITYPAPANG